MNVKGLRRVVLFAVVTLFVGLPSAVLLVVPTPALAFAQQGNPLNPPGELPAFDANPRAAAESQSPDQKRQGLILDASLVPANLEYRVEFEPGDLDHLKNQGKGSAFQIGVNKRLDSEVRFAALAGNAASPSPEVYQSGILRRTPEGRIVWTARISAPEAGAVRIYFTDFSLPDGVEIFVYDTDQMVLGPFKGSGPLGTGSFWTPVVPSGQVYIEVRTASGTSAPEQTFRQVSFVIREVAILDPSADQGLTATPQLAPNAGCVIDRNCATFPLVDVSGNQVPLADILGGATALMVFSDGPGTYICSGGLVNVSWDAGFIPYFLTANHCISTQQSASSLVTYWDYRTTSCNAAYPSRYSFPSALGATLLATNAQSDFTFLRLTEDPPPNRWYLGWTPQDYSTSGGTTIYRISYPKGSPQMASTHAIQASSPTCSTLPRGRFIYSLDTFGATEGGSSGSPIVLDNGSIIGQLYGVCGTNINDVCDNVNNYTVDGSFAVTYPSLTQWLVQQACTAPEAPVLSAPASANSALSYAVTWTATSPDNAYELQESTTAGFSSPTTFSLSATSRNFSHTVTQTTRYYYRVRAVDNCNGTTYYSAWSAVDFTDVNPPAPVCVAPNAPVLSAPASANSAQSYAVTWTATSPDSAYELQESTAAGFGSPTTFSLSATSRNFSHTVIQTTRYYYRVRAVDNCNGTAYYSAWSTVDFTDVNPLPPVCVAPNAPVLSAPASANSTQSYAVTWTTTSPDSAYELQESTSAGFSSPTTFSLAVTSRNFSHTVMQISRYYYRVRAIDNCNGTAYYSTWSTVDFTDVNPLPPVCVAPNAPVLSAPASADSTQSYAVTWTATSPDSAYELQESTSAGFGSPTTFSLAVTSRNFSHTVIQTTRYYYRVRAIDNCNGTAYYSAWSAAAYTDVNSSSVPGNLAVGGYLGVGTETPQRAVHVSGPNAVFRLDRYVDSAAFLLVRTDSLGTPLKTFVVGANASGVNQGDFSIDDMGSAVGGTSQKRMTITNSGETIFSGSLTAPQYFQQSSLRFKTNIRPLEDPLARMTQLRGVRFDWRQTGLPSLGLIAEEVFGVMPQLVSRDSSGGVQGLSYDSLVTLQLEASRAQRRKLEDLREKYRRLVSLLAELKKLNSSAEGAVPQ